MKACRVVKACRVMRARRVLLYMAPPFVAAGVVLSLANQSGGPVAFCGLMLGSPSIGPFVAYGGL
jgi:hypothetical protein